MRLFSKALLASTLLAGIATSSFAATYSSSSSSVVTSGPHVSAPMAPMANSNPDMISDVQTIRSCLCLQSSYMSQSSAISAKQANYQQVQSQKAAYDQMVASAKTGTTPAQLPNVRQASENSIILQNQINNSILPDLQNATAQYNQTVATYQQSCGSKSYNADMLAQAKAGLTCQGG